MKVLGVQAVQSTPESLLLLDSPAVGTSGTEEGKGVGALFLHIGKPPSLPPCPASMLSCLFRTMGHILSRASAWGCPGHAR